MHVPRVGYGRPIYAGPRRLAPAPFRSGRPVPGYNVVPMHRAGGPRPVGAPHRMGQPPQRVSAVQPGPRGPAARPTGRQPVDRW